ncbi:MAG: hypothetical protein P4M00_06310 [Azospirillaceae bacterium]|nr:hypothetical protein [Azospirillaceae bacterium]
MTIRPVSAFGSVLRGDTLFGQLCWAARYRQGEAGLRALLAGYTQGAPFLVVSDAFPAGHLPRPELPPRFWPQAVKPEERKQWKRRRYLPASVFARPLAAGLEAAAAEAPPPRPFSPQSQAHNSIRRDTATTGEGDFAPYQLEQLWPAPGLRLDLHLVHDPVRLPLADLLALLTDVGATGYGRDGSLGLGRFEIEAHCGGRPSAISGANAWMTLAPTAPQGQAWHEERCFYRPFTRFGRHGGIGALMRPFKTPVLLMDTGAVLTPATPDFKRYVMGIGLGGGGELSQVIPETVHQGYAPVMPVLLDESGGYGP